MTFLLNDDFILRHLRPDLRNARVAPCLLGPPAIGKTMAVNALAQNGDFAVFSIDVNTLSDAADLTGVRTVPDPANPNRFVQIFFPHYTIQEANDYAEEHPDTLVVILLDEINRTSSDVTSAALTLLTSRRCGNLKLADNIRFIVTGNDKGNISMLDSASLTRFALYPVRPDAKVLLNLLGEDLQPAIRDVLTEHPDWVLQSPTPVGMVTVADEDPDDPSSSTAVSDREMAEFASQMDDSQDMSQYTAPRTIEGLNLWMNELGPTVMAELAVEEAVSPDGQTTTELMLGMLAHTGNTAFTAEVHAKVLASLLAPAATSGPGAMSVSRPAAWDKLRAATTQNQIEQIISSLDTDKQADVLIFALTTKGENTLTTQVVDRILEIGALSTLNKDQRSVLLNRGTSGVLNPASVSYFLGKSTEPLVVSLTPIHEFLAA
ncbi:ATP-binding protein [Gordonia sp. KTR9]|uniref:ATP-binding protein n=1 Tax=Gordonia sp. KTR9 TaxID=337191 RepID=UPI0001DD94C8|nr:AAA family ATPase [Gordonia sp. KTR9]ADK68983.1 MoxR-like ATPases [Gordonia sp. KTR9]